MLAYDLIVLLGNNYLIGKVQGIDTVLGELCNCAIISISRSVSLVALGQLYSATLADTGNA